MAQKVPHVQGSCWKGERVKACTILSDVKVNGMNAVCNARGRKFGEERACLFISYFIWKCSTQLRVCPEEGNRDGERLQGASEATWFVQLGEELRGTSPQSAASSVEGELLASYRTG